MCDIEERLLPAQDDWQTALSGCPTRVSDEYWAATADDNASVTSCDVTSYDDDDVSVSLSWLQSYYDDHQQQLTPSINTESSQSDGSLVSDHLLDHFNGLMEFAGVDKSARCGKGGQCGK